MKLNKQKYYDTTYKIFTFLPALFLTGLNIHYIFTFGLEKPIEFQSLLIIIMLFSHYLLAFLIIKRNKSSLSYAIILMVLYSLYLYIGQDNTFKSVSTAITIYNGYYILMIVLGLFLKKYYPTVSSTEEH